MVELARRRFDPWRRVFGLGIETADMLVNEVMTRRLRDRRAVARYAGITGSPDESGARRRENGSADPEPGRCRSACRFMVGSLGIYRMLGRSIARCSAAGSPRIDRCSGP
jgi:hypothetical protein